MVWSFCILIVIADPAPHTLYFGVKFYAADPCKLQEEITRYALGFLNTHVMFAS